MKYLLFVLFVWVASATKVETTPFFNQKINYTLSFKTYSGYQYLDWYYPNTTAGIYYSLWQGMGDSLNDSSVPLIIWLQGGPGASSQFGCFNEVGPLYVHGDKNFTIQQNGFSWSQRGHLLCIDQPIGVGFSYNKGGKPVTDTYEAARHFQNFLFNFLNEWQMHNNPIYISGQSYAGHYIPAFTRYLLTNSSLHINLKGIMIGDGYLDPENQMNYYDSFMYTLGIASEYARDTATYIQNQALLNILKADFSKASEFCNLIVDNDDNNNKYFGGANLMNYKKYNQDNINSNYWKFLQENKKTFGVPDDVHFIEDGEAMYLAFGRDISMSFADQLEFILESGLRVLIYNGQNDIIINTAGVLNYLNSLNWRGLRMWSKTPKQQWMFLNKNVGWYKNYDNLHFVLIRDAGHLVPSDQPAVASAMISRFMRGAW